jgi:D-alanyl-D-alanine carboxypeptidase (penicillin-binding protein 5/6)
MKRLIAFLLAAGASMSGAFAQLPQPPEIAARSYVLLDLTTHTTLAERNADAPADPASLTKLMTAYLVFGALRDRKLTLEQTLPVSVRAWDERKGGASVMFVEPRMTPTVDELLHGMIVQSGNDASVALAEGVAGTVENFVAMMNRQAETFGLKNTSFKNVTGMSESGHSSTARDLAVIASRIISDFPDFYPYYSIRQYTFNKIKQDNRNLLLGRDPSVDGMKTGFTEAAGYCLIASAQREFPNLGAGGDGPGQRRLLSVVLGTDSREARASESQKLLNWGFTAWDAIRLFEAGAPIATPEVWKGTVRQVKLGVAGPVLVAVPHGEGAKLQTRVERTDPLVAPLAQNQRVGTLRVTTSAGAAVTELPLVALEAVPEAGLFGRAWDALRLWIK